MNKFNSIKKSRKKSKDIDEKIEYLDKECQKTGLNEITMSTSGIYQGSTQIPNQDYSDFESQSQGGYGLGFSGADGNSAGDASLINGVAYSPPHPVTGVRRAASHVRDGLGGTEPLRPGQITFRGFGDNPPPYTMGSALWFFDDDYNNGVGQPAGRWCNLEWSNFPGSIGWGFWDTVKTGQFAGLYKFETNLSLHPCGDISGKIAGINFGINGALGAPQTIVLTQNPMDDPTHLPINIDGISPQAFDYLRGRANGNDIARTNLSPFEESLLRNQLNAIIKSQGIEAGRREQQRLLQMYGIYFPLALNTNQPVDIASHDRPLFRSVPATGPRGGRPAHPLEIQAIQGGGATPSTPRYPLGIPLRLTHFKPKGQTLSESVKSKKFNIIKKSRKKSKGIDEKIEYLNKECQKTGLQEVMRTTSVYQGKEKIPNATHSNFNSASFNGMGLGHSGSDGTGNGGAYTGKVIASEHGLTPGIHDYILNLDGVAVSPPHPVSGRRRYASTRTGMVTFSPTQPGKVQGNSDYPTGSVMWIWNPNANNLDGTTGNWYPLEFDVSRQAWGFWDSNFLGFGFLNIDLSQLELPGSGNVGSTVVNLLNSLGINDKNNIGEPETIVLTQNSLDDPSFIPINIGGLSKPGYEYLKNMANDAKLAGVYDLMKRGQVPFLTPDQVNKILVDPKFQKLLQDDPDILPILQRMRAMADDGTEIASTDPSAAFPSAPSPDSSMDTNQNGTKPSKAKGADAKLGKWMSRTDFMALYPNSTVTEYLNALPYGGTNFMKPDPNFPGAKIVDTDAYEKYFMTGDTSGLSDSKPKHKETPEVEYTPQELKKGFSANQILNYLKTKFKSPLGPATDIIADIVADTFGQRGSKAILDDYTRNFVPALLSGENVAGKTSGNPRNVGNLYSNKTLNDYEEIYKDYQKEKRGEKDLKGLDLPWTNKYTILQDANSEIGNTTGTLDPEKAGDGFVDNGDGTETLIKRYDFDNLKDMAGSNVASNLGALTYGVISGIPSLLGKGESGRTPSAYIGITFDKKTGKVIKNYNK